MQQMNNSILGLAFIHNWNILPTFQFHLWEPIDSLSNNATILEHKGLSNETTKKEIETSTMAVSEA